MTVLEGQAIRIPASPVARAFDYVRAHAEIGRLALFVVGYLLSVWASEHAYGSLAVPSPFWFPDAVLLCALLLTRRDRWWLVIAATWPIRLAAGAPAGTPYWFLLSSVANDSLKGLAAAWLLQRIVGRSVRLTTFRELLIFIAIAMMAVPALSALAAVPLRAALGDAHLWTAWSGWFLGNALAQAVVTPMLLYWATYGPAAVRFRWQELLLHSAGLIAILYYAFVLPHATYSPGLLYAPVPLLLWAAVRLRPFGTANATALVAIAAMVSVVRGTGVFSVGSSADNVLSIQLYLLVVAVSLLLLATLIAENLAATEELRLAERWRQELSGRLINAQEQERGRIARELHDDFGQRVASFSIALSRIKREVNDASSPVGQSLVDLQQQAARLSSDLRHLSHDLHPGALEHLGLLQALRARCHEFTAEAAVPVRFEVSDTWRIVPDAVALCLYRVAQEALRNVALHARARNVVVSLDRQGRDLVMRVIDDGGGFDARPGSRRSGLGLVSLGERVRMLGGALEIASVPHAGTRLTVTLPLREPHAT